MRAIGFRMSQMEGVWAKVWPESNGNVIRFYGYSTAALYPEIKKGYEKIYQKALDDGEVEEEDEESLGAYNYSRPVRGDIYGQGEDSENEEENKAADKQLTKKMMWVNENKRESIPLLWDAALEKHRKSSRNSRAQALISKGDWSGAGSLYRLGINNVQEKQPIRVGPTGAGTYLKGKNVKANLVEASEQKKTSKDEKKRAERMQVRLGKDVMVFTRF
jgi:hypothetical protein